MRHLACWLAFASLVVPATAAAAPDLTVTAFAAPSGAPSGGTITMTDTVAASGGAVGPFYVQYYLSRAPTVTTADQYVGRRYVSGLAAGASSSGTTALTLPTGLSGAYYLAAIADAANAVAESDETNNGSAAIPLSVTPPDLTITAFGAPSGAPSGGTITVTDTVAASGGAAGPFYVQYYLSRSATVTTADQYVGRRYVAGLAAGASSSGTTALTLPTGLSGAYYLAAIADAPNAVPESNEANNGSVAIPFSVTAPDLTMTAVQASPVAVATGGTFTVADTVAATGAGVGPFYVHYYLSRDAAITTADQYVGRRYVAGLAAGATSSASTSLTVPAGLSGSYYIGAIADAPGAVPESDETNNALAGNQVTVGLPDLSMTAFGAPAAATSGGTMTVTDTVTATGGAAGPFYVHYYLSNDATITTSDLYLGRRYVAGLPAGASSAGSTSLPVPGGFAGTYYLGAIADAPNAVPESNEGNNVSAVVAVTVASAPSVVTTTVSASPAQITAGGPSAIITVTVRDASSNPVPGVAAMLSSTGVGDTVTQPASLTGADGVATGRIQGTSAGSRSVTAFVGGVPVVQVAGVTVVAGAPASLAFGAGPPASVAAGAPFGAVVDVLDQFGNLTGGSTNVSLAVVPAGTLHGTATAAASGGIATFGGLTVNEAAPGWQLVATSAGLASATSSSFSVIPAGASRLAFAVQPYGGRAGAPFVLPVVVAVQDAFGNVVTSGTQSVALALAGGTSGATLSGGSAAATVNGSATFAAVSVDKAGNGYTLAATSSGLAGASSTGFAIEASDPAPALCDLTVSKPYFPAGGTANLTVTVRDAFGNFVSGVAVMFQSTFPSDAIPSRTTNVAGKAVVSFSSTVAGLRTVTGLLPGSIPILSTPSVQFVAGLPSAAGSTLVGIPPTTPDDGTPIVLVATIGDKYGNPVQGQSVTLSSTGSASLWQPGGPTAADGTATGTVRALVAGTQTISASVSGSGGTFVLQRDVTFTVAPPSASMSAVFVMPASVPADGSTAASVAVSVADRLGRPIAGATVALAYSGMATIMPVNATTSDSGFAFFTVISSSVGTGTLTATVDAGTGQVVVAQTPSLQFVPTYFISGTVSGLTGSGLVLTTPGAPDCAIDVGATSFVFPGPLATGAGYGITVKAQPAGQNCTVLNGSGTVGNADIRDVIVDCTGSWKQVAAGLDFTVAVRTDGTLYSWGNNIAGQLGDGTTTQRNAPGLVGIGFASVAAGAFHTVAVKTDGSLYAWGDNSGGQLGLLGDGTVASHSVPVLVGTGFASVAAGDAHTVAVKTDGSLYAWGRNDYGQLGDGTKMPRLTPTLIGSGFAFVAAGQYHTIAVKTDGSLYAWGDNGYGQLGDGTTTQRLTPTLIGSGFASVATGIRHTVGVKTDGTLSSWGDNMVGQLGDGTTAQRLTPTPIGSGFASVAAGDFHTIAVKWDHSLYAWGFGASGELGDGSSGVAYRPELVGSGFASACAGAEHSCAVKTDGSLYAWGDNSRGQLGDGSATERHAPVLVDSEFVSVVAGVGYAVGLRPDGSLYAWGSGGYALGDGSSNPQYTPLFIGSGFASIAAGYDHTVGLKTDGSLWTWGSNYYGQLGDGSTNARATPMLIGTGYVAIAAGWARTFAVKSDGSLYSWGFNYYGQLGDGTTTPRNTPTLVGTGFASVAAGLFHTVAAKTDGSLYVWGGNDHGQLGDGTTTQRLTPTLIGSEFASVAGGQQHTVAVKMDGSLYAWGYNNEGELGDGSTVERHVPTFVGTGFVSVTAGDRHTVAVKSDGSLYAWGDNLVGQLGDGTNAQRLTPTLIGSGFASVSAGSDYTFAIRLDRSLWAWGENAEGQLGEGTVPALTPRRVPGIATVFGLAYSTNPVTYAHGGAVTSNVPWSTGGPITSYAVSPPLPDGLLLDTATGILSGTPTVASPMTSYVVTATGTTGTTTTALLTITVN